jgi:ABC-type multidrug transport system fused ATPase/permease subunit
MKSIKFARQFFSKKLIFFVALSIPLIFVSTILEMVGISLVPLLITILFDPTKILVLLDNVNFTSFLWLRNWILSYNNTELVGLFSFLFIAIYFFKNLILLFIIFFENFLTFKMKLSLISKLSTGYFSASYIFHINSNSTHIINNLNTEIKIAAEYFRSVIACIREIFLISGIIITLIKIYPYITFISLCFVAFTSSIFFFFLKNYLYKMNKIAFYYRRKFQNIIKQGLGSIKSTLVLQKEKFLIKEIIKDAHLKEHVDFKISFFSKLPRIYLELILILLILLIVLLTNTTNNLYAEAFTILVTLSIAMIRLLPSFNNLLSNLINVKNFEISTLHIYNEIKKLNKDSNYSHHINCATLHSNENKKITNLYGDIKFLNVDYKYPHTNNYIFKNLSITLKNSHNIAIIGNSGVGKTTFVDLILGLLKPTKGKITSNNIDINTNQEVWRNNLGYIPQEIYLLDDTIKNNILIGVSRKKINQKKLNLSLKNSGVSGFFRNQKYKLNTKVGENGIKISGGQKQRIGIARALYKDPKIIIFDEATNSLDKKNEHSIISDIKKFSKNKTIIFITHKLDNLKFFNTVIEIKGKKAKIIK